MVLCTFQWDKKCKRFCATTLCTVDWNSKETLQKFYFWFMKVAYLRKKCKKCIIISKIMNLKNERKFNLFRPQRDSNPGPQGYQGPLNDLQKISLFSILWATYWYYRAQFGLKMSALICSIEIWSKTIKKLRQIYQFCKLNQILSKIERLYNPIFSWSHPATQLCHSTNECPSFLEYNLKRGTQRHPEEARKSQKTWFLLSKTLKIVVWLVIFNSNFVLIKVSQNQPIWVAIFKLDVKGQFRP